MKHDGIENLRSALRELDWSFNELIAKTAIWINPECYKFHVSVFGNGVYYQNTRRLKKGERRGEIISGIRMDDNTYPNTAIKQVMGGRALLENYTTCHIYKNSCYDPKYHTELANLVLLPSPIASLSDFFDESIQALKYRSYELFGFYIGSVPAKPKAYPKNWRDDIQFNEEIKKKILRKNNEIVRVTPSIVVQSDNDGEFRKLGRIKLWAKRHNQINHKIVAAFINLEQKGDVKRREFKALCSDAVRHKKYYVTNFEGHFASMKSDHGNSHGKVFYEHGEFVKIWEPVWSEIQKHFLDDGNKT